MTFQREKLALFYSLPLDDIDWANLRLSRVKRVQIVGDMATDRLIAQFRDAGIEGVCIRLSNTHVGIEAARWGWRDLLSEWTGIVDTVILGNEPDAGLDLKYGSPGWGQDIAWRVRDSVLAMSRLLIPLNRTLRCISPAGYATGHYRDWREGLQPGRWTWDEITRDAYDACAYNGFHWYSPDGTAFDIAERMRADLWTGQSAHHKPLWIDEVGIAGGTQRERMRGCLRLASLLLRVGGTGQSYSGAGERVECLTPFVSNGQSDGSWDQGYVMRDPLCYRDVADYLQGKDFTG